ncbi:MAG: valine--tRNA ligase [Armatimonadetes bacterium]|nr:valine--tRNA ligase [Armatimonadota bacterium]
MEQKSGYDAKGVESKWYSRWEESGAFSPKSGSDPYVITIPPPNITGSLHMGHALCYSIQDLLGRYHRMRGRPVLILPGQDHAGIATQSVVIKQLKKAGVNPFSLSRDEFVEKVWEWRNESGNAILNQSRSLGCAFDWSRTRFTLDPQYAEAVLKVFIDWFDAGLIYKGLRVVNWDIALKTSVSDIETERKDVAGKLYHIRYPFADGSGDVVIATTRPETMLADVAVAVHPKDARYTGLVGRMLRLPLVDREIPLIADEYPDPEFGTGAVKITPAHDPNDYEVGQRHNLGIPCMMDESGKVTEIGGPYAGLDRLEARKEVVADLEEQGFLVKVEDHSIPILVSERSGEIIEPLASEQWFVSQKPLAERAIHVVESGEVTFHPPRYKDVYLDWMNNIRDWCISRQLMWGHRIPIYYTESGRAVAALSWEEAEAKAGEPIASQEKDVLDTWFSSGLWPFATMGWPEQTEDLERYFPTDVLVTARDIIFLWVSRMVMMSLYFTGKIPFKDVYIYATVLTEKGERMSKSLGTGVDPMGVVESKGADALRFTLLSQSGYNQDIRYSERKTDDARNFCNKIWNASRFILMNLEGYEDSQPAKLDTLDRWLLSRLAQCEETVRTSYESYDIQAGMAALYKFFWSELCDWYIEQSKVRLQDPAKRQTPQWVLLQALSTFLKMMHPAIPFITEEVYALLPLSGKAGHLMDETWPSVPSEWWDQESESKVESWIEMTRAIRALRADVGLQPLKSSPQLYCSESLGDGAELIRGQAWFDDLLVGPAPGTHVTVTSHGVDFHIPLEGVDVTKELARLEREVEKTAAELAKLSARLENPSFVERAKPEVVERERAAAADLASTLEKLEKRRAVFGGG